MVRGPMIRWCVAALAAVLLTACLSSDVQRCADGRVCPAGAQCDDVHHSCVICIGGECSTVGGGNGAIGDGEACDGNDFGSLTCQDFGFHEGTLACDPSCDAIDTSGCSGRCGDGERDGPEICDGDDFGLLSCISFGF